MAQHMDTYIHRFDGLMLTLIKNIGLDIYWLKHHEDLHEVLEDLGKSCGSCTHCRKCADEMGHPRFGPHSAPDYCHGKFTLDFLKATQKLHHPNH